jgi:ABC-type multidrug transport system ATPase subunit
LEFYFDRIFYFPLTGMDELKVDSIVMTFGSRKVLSDIYLSCKPGEIVGLLGRNGSGKSTLMKIICGSLTADSSYVNINGAVMTNRFKRSSKIAYLYQDDSTPFSLKVPTLLKLFKAKDLSHHPMVKKVMHQKFGELSGGEARFLEILCVLNCPAQYILLDEPFNGLSPILKEEIKKEIKKAVNTKGIIITDHDYTHVLDITSKNYLMTNGNLKEVNRVQELRDLGYLSPF